MKRAFFIGAGTLGSLSVVFAITPPQFGTTNSLGSGGQIGGPFSGPTGTSSQTPTPTPTATSFPVVTSATPSAPPTKVKPTHSFKPPKPTPTPTHSTTSPTPTPTPTPTHSTTSPTPKPTPTPTPTHSTTSPTPTPTPTPTHSTTSPTPTPTANGASGTFTGAGAAAGPFGTVRVTVTLSNGVISAVTADQNPSSRGPNAFALMDPYVAGQKISISAITATAASKLPFVSQVSYSSMAYWQSLKSALSQAGL
jgi:uncharacterized protein with FMN-binding domain